MIVGFAETGRKWRYFTSKIVMTYNQNLTES
jgi:hypothetical protein